MSKEGTKPGYVEMDEGAVEAARAEKPFRDALADHRDSLGEEARQSLDWLAAQEGEKAAANYQGSKGKEQDRARELLRKRALESAIPRLPGEEKIPGIIMDFFRWAAESIAAEQIDLVLEKKLPPDKTLKELSAVGIGLRGGINLSMTGGNENAIDLLLRWRNEGWTDKPVLPEEANVLRGVFIADLISGKSERAVSALALINRADEDKKAEIKRRLPIIEHWRGTGRILTVVTDVNKDVRVLLDRELERAGLLWDPEGKKYISM